MIDGLKMGKIDVCNFHETLIAFSCVLCLYLLDVQFNFKYSQTCVQRPPLGPEKRGRYAEGYMKKISGQ